MILARRIVHVGRSRIGDVTLEMKLWNPNHGSLCYSSYWRVKGVGMLSRQVAEMVGSKDGMMRTDIDHDELVTLLAWEEYDMNAYHSACEHQRLQGYEDPRNPNRDKLLGEKCLICGHRYGREWVTIPLPDELIQYVKGGDAEVVRIICE